MKNNYKKLMKKCIALAKKSEGFVSPNPLVGAVVLDKDGNIAGFGRHERCGEAHAEVNALKMAADKAKGGTIIVNLEPCSHFGKTPPCADLIIEKGLKKVVIGTLDPNPIVAGNGIKKLENAGIEVVCGVLEAECKKLNEIFFINQTEKRIFTAIKTATTIDGKIASRTGDSKWVTGEKSRKIVQKLRKKYDALLTGSNTVLADNPAMNCRLKNGVNPIRVVVDSKLRLTPDLRFFNDDKTPIYCAISENLPENRLKIFPKFVNFIKCPLIDEKIDLKFLFEKLYEAGIRSVLVEAGGGLNGAVLKAGLADKIYHFTAPKIIGDNQAVSCFSGFETEFMKDTKNLRIDSVRKSGDDLLVEYKILR